MGSYGVELKRNLKNLWWKYFISTNPYNVGSDSLIITHPQVLVSSGHLKNFHDWLVECGNCQKRYRLDNLISQEEFTIFLAQTEKNNYLVKNSCPTCGGNNIILSIEISQSVVLLIGWLTWIFKCESYIAITSLRFVKKDLELKDRIFFCVCGYKADRDINAAKNILYEAQATEQELSSLDENMISNNLFVKTPTEKPHPQICKD